MSHSPLSTQLDDCILIIELDNAPVNALGVKVRAVLDATLRQAEKDVNIRAIVLTSKAKLFCGGADITEFSQPPRAPALVDIFAGMDTMMKPIVAAINGAALGGGYELALACDQRVASAEARIGLPEINLGLMPGAGGTQRLARLVGATAALDFVTSGKAISADRALQIGLVDKVVPPADLLAVALATARDLVSSGKRRRLTARLTDTADKARFEAAAAIMLTRFNDAQEREAIIESLRSTFKTALVEGTRVEQKLFQVLRRSPRSTALRHVFFAEKESVRIADIDPATEPFEVKQVAVIGGGTMGAGIAIAFANSGFPVTIIETTEAGASAALERAAGIYEISVKRGNMTSDEKTKRFALIEAKAGIEHAAPADFVVESAFEEMSIKEDIFRKLDAVAKPTAILATNTSYLNVNHIAAVTSRPQSVLGMHFFSPANVMKLVEVVNARKTSPQVLLTAVEISRRLGKMPVVVGVCHGFVGNRMLEQRSMQVDRLLLEGASPKQVDRALTDFGFRMGPCAMADMAGLDISWRMRRATGKKLWVADAFCEAGRFGQKTGCGYYLYPGGARAGQSDPDGAALIRTVSQSKGVQHRIHTDQEVLERLLYPMINEGAKILEENIAARSSDIDVIWLHGYGWPRDTGGPMYYGKQIGGKKIAEALKRYAEQADDVSTQIAEILNRL